MNSAREESLEGSYTHNNNNEFQDQGYKHGSGGGSRGELKLIISGENDTVVSNNKNKYFLHQPFMRSSYSKKGLVVQQQTAAGNSLHAYQAKRKGY
jgi:hypothetical protein